MLDNINIHYGDKIIFENTCFSWECNQLTLILGKSGSGKSTLLNYIKDNIDYTAISYMKQNPEFHPDLTMKEQLDLLQRMYSYQINEELLNNLDIYKTLNSYPLNLSGGEKLRWGFLFCIIKQADIVLCDEPTASLDWKKKEIIMKYLQDYARAGHQVIVVSHDEDFKEYADRIYYIQEHQLIEEKKSPKSSKVKETELKALDLSAVGSYLRKTVKHKKGKHYFVYISLALSIVLICLSLKFKENLLSIGSKQTIETSQLVVYKGKDGYQNISYSYDGQEDGFSQEEIEEILNIDHVCDLQERYDYNFFTATNNIVEDKSIHYSEYCKYTLTDQNENTYDIDCQIYGSISAISYDSTFDYSQDIAYHLSEEQGIYLNAGMYRILTEMTGIEKLENCTLTFTFLIPKYNLEYNIYSDSKHEDIMIVNSQASIPVQITLPISGVTKSKKMGVLLNGDLEDISQYLIYYPNTVIEQYIDHEDQEIHVLNTVIVDGEDRIYLDRLPEEYDSYISCSYLYPWKSDSYYVYLDDYSYLPEVKESLENLGYCTICDITEETNSEFLDFLFQKSFKIIAVLFLIIVLIVYTFIIYLSKAEYKEEYDFYKEYIVDPQLIKGVIRKKYTINTIRLIIYSLVLLLFVVWYISSSSRNAHFGLSDSYMIIIVVGMSLVYSWLIPMLAGGKND